MEEEEELRECKTCGIIKIKTKDFYSVKRLRLGKPHIYYKNECKTCSIKDSRIRSWETYGINITYEEYEKRYSECKGKCQSCGSEFDVLDVDHCHISGDIRGLLCKKCNKGIGLLGDNKEGVEKALDYLMVQTSSNSKSDT